MNKATARELECFQKEAEADCEAWVEMATSGELGGYQGMPMAVADTADLYVCLGLQGKLQVSDTLLLKQALKAHLEISQRHARLWIHPNPDAEELATAWYLQTESLAAWNRFVAFACHLGNLKSAHGLAFKDFPPQPPQFLDDADRIQFVASLKNQQQDFIGGNHHVPVRVLEQDSLMAKLEPTQQRLLTLLMDGKPKSVTQLLWGLFGSRSQTEDNKRKLTRRVSDLNKALDAAWGKPPQGRWVERIVSQGESAYRLIPGKTAF